MTNTTPNGTKVSDDSVNHPSHYTQYPVEVIQLTEHMDFCRGNAVKYLARAGFKDPAKELEDLKKARWYTDRAISKLEKELEEKTRKVDGSTNGSNITLNINSARLDESVIGKAAAAALTRQVIA